MRILLDTQCWLWLQASPERLSPGAYALVADLSNELFFSAASAWEIAIKHALGKLRLPCPPSEYVQKRMETSGVRALPVSIAHALRVSELPPHHRDPFDRLLVAQAQLEKLSILTADRQLSLYDVTIEWATGSH